MSCLKYTSAWSRPLKPAPPETAAATRGYSRPRACVKILKFLCRRLICRRRSAVAIMPQPLGGVSAP